MRVKSWTGVVQTSQMSLLDAAQECHESEVLMRTWSGGVVPKILWTVCFFFDRVITTISLSKALMFDLHTPVDWQPLAAIQAICSKWHIITAPASGGRSCSAFVYLWGETQAHSQYCQSQNITSSLREMVGKQSKCSTNWSHKHDQDCCFLYFVWPQGCRTLAKHTVKPLQQANICNPQKNLLFSKQEIWRALWNAHHITIVTPPPQPPGQMWPNPPKCFFMTRK